MDTPYSFHNRFALTFNFLDRTLGWISISPNFSISSVALPIHSPSSWVNKFATASSKGLGGSFHNSVSVFVRFQMQRSRSNSRCNFWSCWSRPTISSMALLSVLFSFCNINAPSAAPKNPFVPEMVSKLSSALCFLVWWTSSIQIL